MPNLTHYQLRDAARKQQIINDYQRSGLSIISYCQANSTAPSYQTMYRWLAAYREGGFERLASHYGKNHGRSTVQPDILHQVLRLYLTQNKMNLRYCIELTKQRTGEKISYSAVRRAVQNIPTSVIDKYRMGEKYYNDRHKAHISRDYTKLKVMESVCMDHHLIDVFARENGKARRVWLTAAQDMRSRYIVAWRISNSPTELTIAECLYDITQKHGVAEQYYIDNGRDFKSNLLSGTDKKDKNKPKILLNSEKRKTEIVGIYSSIGSRVVFATPYHPESKPIERFFREVNQQFSRMFFSYAGSNTADRPDRVKELWKKSKKDISKLPTIDDIRLAFEKWLTWWHAGHQHSGHGMDNTTPREAFQTFPRIEYKEIPPQYLPIIFSRVEKRAVYQGEITWDTMKYYHDKLILYSGQSVECLRPIFDTHNIYVRDPQGRIVCQAKAQALLETGQTENDLRRLSRAKKSQKQAVNQYLDSAYGKLPQLVPITQDHQSDEVASTAVAASSEVKNPILREEYL